MSFSLWEISSIEGMQNFRKIEPYWTKLCFLLLLQTERQHMKNCLDVETEVQFHAHIVFMGRTLYKKLIA